MKTLRNALLLCLVIGPQLLTNAAADDLGRLFTSGPDRARIDALRAGRSPQLSTSAPADRLVVNGTLRGSDGKRIVWLNGAPTQPSKSNEVSLLRDGRVQLNLRDGAKILKPGQGLDQATGKIYEYQTPVTVPVAASQTANENAASAASRSDSTSSPATSPAPAQDAASVASTESNAGKPAGSATPKAK